jgi:ATP-binding protein involved in chromosome partitioning
MSKVILDILSEVIHPATGENIVALDMVENLRIEDETIKFNLVFKRRDPLAKSIKSACEEILKSHYPEKKISILELVRETKKQKSIGLELGQEQLADIGKIIAIASGKGGVGKSTVAVNLAITLARQGYKVGVADADVYGPSIPKMTATEGALPEVITPEGAEPNGNELIVPIEKYGVKWMSIGYFAAPEQALIWRGPMACNALKQMILQVAWGELDYLLIDLPPGTGDIHITLVGDIPIDGAIIVSTPQAVALADVEKGINLFRNPNVNKPIFGIIENMSWFTPAELPDNKYFIFGKNGGEKMAQKYNVPLLAQIPLIQSVCECGDQGAPAALEDGAVYDALSKINL